MYIAKKYTPGLNIANANLHFGDRVPSQAGVWEGGELGRRPAWREIIIKKEQLTRLSRRDIILISPLRGFVFLFILFYNNRIPSGLAKGNIEILQMTQASN